MESKNEKENNDLPLTPPSSPVTPSIEPVVPSTTPENGFINVIDILQSVLSNNKTTLHDLSNKEIQFIQKMMIESPETFHSISEQINEIIKDKKIDISEIPKIIHIIAIIFITDFSFKKVDVIACVRFTLDTIIDSGLLPLNAIETMALKSIIDTSLDLLKINLPRIETRVENFFNGLFKFLHNHSCCS